MDSLQPLLLFLDPWLIAPYRLIPQASLGYLFGTALLALQCVFLGDLATTGVAYLNRDYLRKLQQKMDHHHALSEKALMMGDKESYKAVNRQGLDAFGYQFSMGAALFCVSIWPMPFALAWQGMRFTEAPLVLPFHLPFTGTDIPYLTSFLLIYILMRICYSKVMNKFTWYAEGKAKIMHQPTREV